MLAAGYMLLLAGADPEFTACGRWVAARFAGVNEPDPPGLRVLANNDPVQLNARAGRPLRVGEATFARGLYCHAVSDIEVMLPGPARRLTAIIGVDSNDQTSGGRGSVVFAVRAGDRTLFESALLREGMAAVPIEVDLAGAERLHLLVGDGGDGISCDQADWAEAAVELVDGRTLYLGELPLLEGDLLAVPTEPPFSFTLDGVASEQLLATWPCERTREVAADGRTRYRNVWRSPDGLEVACDAVAYADFAAAEWTVTLTHRGPAPSGLIADLRGLDAVFPRGAAGEWALHHQVGSICTAEDFAPRTTPLPAGAEFRLAAAGGRGSNGTWPYWNLQHGGGGLMVAVGWPGQWAAGFQRDAGAGLRLTAGQELTRFRLQPGESARTPLIALFWYTGDRWAAQNRWRRWMAAWNVPRPGGQLPPVQHVACSSHQFGEMIRADEASQITFIDRYHALGLPLEYWWMDAGWYPNATGWPNTGTWEIDPVRFPRGFRPITDHGRAVGTRSIVWFEPERVTPGTWLWEQHPDWLLGSDAGNRLLDLGNAAARAWLTDHVDAMLTREGIDLYRQDFNIDPLPYWRATDADDRRGLTENHYVSGYLAWWDELRRRHPDMLIDSCASGGRRNDLETMRRAVPLLRSDYIFEPVGQQGHLWGLSLWLPYSGSGFMATDAYTVRSTFCASINTCWDVRREDLDEDAMRARIAEWRRVAPLMLGDYWPLTPHDLSPSAWMAWQFDRPAEGDGVVMAFRHADSVYESARLPLRGLDRAATYELSDADRPGWTATAAGAELSDTGLLVQLGERPGSALVFYRRR